MRRETGISKYLNEDCIFLNSGRKFASVDSLTLMRYNLGRRTIFFFFYLNYFFLRPNVSSRKHQLRYLDIL